MLTKIVDKINKISKNTKVVFPVHPRTEKSIKGYKLQLSDRVVLLPPIGYLEFIALQNNASLVITDSGGVQEETTYLGVPCLTLRLNTERPITIVEGTNELTSIKNIDKKVTKVINGIWKDGKIPKFWDGKTSLRIAKVLTKQLS
jgi:UDP-N-acetylglucosamine 2-epimerase (non-hydrolysing)